VSDIGPSAIADALRRLSDDAQTQSCSDEHLLLRFVHQRDESAFAALVRRHGPMVLDVCSSLLPNHADAEDAFQACFLILASRARSIRKATSLAAWLHGVAYRTARKAQAEFARRRKHEGRARSPRGATPADELTWREVRRVVHEELNGLSECSRQVLTLCYLQGKTQDQVAAEMDIPRGTLKRRLERARELLRARLVRRGLGPTALTVATVWPAAGISGQVAAARLTATVTAAVNVISGKELAGLVSSQVALMVRGALKTMLFSKTAICLAAITFLAAMASVFAAFGVQRSDHNPERQSDVRAGNDVEQPAVAPKGENEPRLKLQITGPAKPVTQGAEVTLKLVLSTDGGQTYDFLLGALPQVFGIYVQGPAGPVQPDPKKVLPQNWMHQQHSAAAPITVARGRPFQTTVKLSDYFKVADPDQFKPGQYKVTFKFHCITLKMPAPIESNAAPFEVQGPTP
jgi:RNA polymerase sigma factor (sigma-70 family)